MRPQVGHLHIPVVVEVDTIDQVVAKRRQIADHRAGVRCKATARPSRPFPPKQLDELLGRLDAALLKNRSHIDGDWLFERLGHAACEGCDVGRAAWSDQHDSNILAVNHHLDHVELRVLTEPIGDGLTGIVLREAIARAISRPLSSSAPTTIVASAARPARDALMRR